MPNFKIFQDNPDQARIKIYGSTNTALVDVGGSLSVTAPANGLTVTAPAEGLSITAPLHGLTVTAPAEGLSITAPTNGLTVTAPAEGLSITPPSGGLSITAPAGGLSITPPADGLLITSPGLAIVQTLATTDVSEVRANITDTTGTPDTTFDVLSLTSWTFGIVNKSLAANAQATVKLQISPDATTWIDHAGPVTIDQNAAETLVASIFLKYARVYYAAVNSTSAVTLNIFFQGQS
ncbi:MAG: DUF6385 domain-containing protein [Bacillota bacterium]